MINLVFLLAALPSAFALDNGVGRAPALGWNSWNAYGCNITEASFTDAANSMISKGFQAAGYQYINIDDCWSVESGRDNTTQQIIPDPSKFPDGISGLADKIHALGFKIGIYSSAGTKTCAGYPASIGYESIDAATFAAWGVDYLKYDNCNVPGSYNDTCEACYPDSLNLVNGTCQANSGQTDFCPSGYDYSQSMTAKRYDTMRDALLAQNRTFLYSLCEWGDQDVWTWGNETANSWRTTGDINATWSRIVSIMNQNSFYINYGGFTGHNDWDMLEVGNGNLTDAETRTHFAFWSLGKSPLIIGTSLDNLSQTDMGVLQNKYLLAFNQDPTVSEGAAPYKWGENPDWTFNSTAPAQYWSGASSNGTYVAMFNVLNDTQTMTATWAEIPGLTAGGSYSVTDAWTGASMGCKSNSADVQLEAHDTAVFVVQPCAPSGYRKKHWTA